MSEGIGTTRYGNQSFQINTRKPPFQVMNENKFIDAPQINFQPTVSLYDELLAIKRQKSKLHVKLKAQIYLGVSLGVSIIFYYLVHTHVS